MAKRRVLKTGVFAGDLSPWGETYQWSVGVYDEAFDEAINLVGEAGYSHLSQQVKQLATENSPTQSSIIDVKPIEDFFEIRDHGGPLGNINIRVFFGVDQQRRTIVVTSTIKKQNNGPTPTPDKVRARVRWRRYLNGEFGFVER